MKKLIPLILSLLFFSLGIKSQNIYMSNKFFDHKFIQIKDGNLTSQAVDNNWKNSEWKIVKTEKSDIVQIVNVATNMALDVENDKLVLKEENASKKSQQWLMKKNSSGDAYVFKSESNNYYLINWGEPDDIGICQFLLEIQCSWYFTEVEQQKEVSEGALIVYTKPGCGRSSSTIDYLKKNKIDFEERSTSNKANNAKMYQDLEKYGNFKSGKITYPIILNGNKIDYSIKNLDKYLKSL